MRRAIGLFAFALVAGACGPRAPELPAGPPPVPLHLEPACDLAPAAGLEGVVEPKPRALAQTAELLPAIGLGIPEQRSEYLPATNGRIA